MTRKFHDFLTLLTWTEQLLWFDRDLNSHLRGTVRSTDSVAYLGGGGMRPSPPPPSESPKTFFDEKKTYIFCSKCRKCHFRDPNFKMGFQTYIFCSKVPSKCRKCRFRDPNFKKFQGGNAPGPPYNCVVTMASPSLKSWLRHCLQLSYTVTWNPWVCSFRPRTHGNVFLRFCILFTVLKGIENNQLITWNNIKTQENVSVCTGALTLSVGILQCFNSISQTH